LSEKILRSSIFLNSITVNRRGEGLQRKIKPEGTIKALGGIDISRYSVRTNRGFINAQDFEEINGNARIGRNSVLVQNIVSHITNPYAHVKIIACLPDNVEDVIMDTINQISVNTESYSKYVIWALLNSKLLNWFVYLFIYGRAIRTMHFDNVITSRIPVPKQINDNIISEINAIGKVIENKAYEQRELPSLQDKLDSLIFSIYNLTDEEIAIIDPDKSPGNHE
jgi:hypothetical protein